MKRLGVLGLLLVTLVGWPRPGELAIGAAQSGTGTAAMLLTEIYYDAPGDDGQNEWLELANLGQTPLELADYKVGDAASSGSREGMVRFPAGARLEAGQAAIVAQTASGFRQLFGRNPDYEIQDSDPAVPDMRRYLVWGTGDFGLANDGDELLLLNERNLIVDAVNYGDKTTFFAPAVAGVFTGQSIERVPAGCDSDSAADWQPQAVPTPGSLTLEGECAAPPDPTAGLALLPIGAIQGRDDVSPYVNQIVSFRGVVTGLYADQNTRGVTFYTLFVQDPAGVADDDPATSDGVAIFLGVDRPQAALGDELLITGQVTEFFGLTEIDDQGLVLQTLAEAGPLPEPVPLWPPPAGYEALESMRVALDEAWVVGPTYAGCGFAVLPAGDEPARVLRQRLEDPLGGILPVLHNTDVVCDGFPQLKVGDAVAGLVGPLTYNFDEFKLVQQDPAGLAITPAALPPLPTPPVAAPDQFTVASFNLENHFDSVDDTGSEEEPKPTADELALKEAKLAVTIGEIGRCPTLLAVQEVENAALLAALAERLAPTCGFVYAVTHLESVDGRGIDVALLSDPGRVVVTEAVLRQGCTSIDTGIQDPEQSCPAGEQPLFSRPPLQVALAVDGQPYTILVNHFKSKREGEAETGPRRLAQAAHINSLVAALLAADEAARILVVGDFNDFDQSPPLLAMTTGQGQLRNALAQVPAGERYSFVFGGASQLIDGILLSPAGLADLVTADILHVNADYPAGWASDLSTPYRSSDHDMPLVVLQLPRPDVPTPTPPPSPTPLPRPEADAGPGGNRWLLPIAGGGLALLVVAVVWWWRRRS